MGAPSGGALTVICMALRAICGAFKAICAAFSAICVALSAICVALRAICAIDSRRGMPSVAENFCSSREYSSRIFRGGEYYSIHGIYLRGRVVVSTSGVAAFLVLLLLHLFQNEEAIKIYIWGRCVILQTSSVTR